MKRAQLEKLWLKFPRLGWRNDGGPIPYRFRGNVRRDGKSKTVIIMNPLQKVRVGHWVVKANGDYFGFDPVSIDMLYIRKPHP